MKLTKYTNESREALINVLKNIDELENEQQNYAIITINAALKEVDTLSRIVNKKEQDTAQQEFFGQLSLPVERWDGPTKEAFSDYKLMVLRLEPTMFKGAKISGYLETYHLPTTIPDIIEETGKKYGGGKFQIRVVNDAGKYVKSKTFEISGLPKIPEVD